MSEPIDENEESLDDAEGLEEVDFNEGAMEAGA